MRQTAGAKRVRWGAIPRAELAADNRKCAVGGGPDENGPVHGADEEPAVGASIDQDLKNRYGTSACALLRVRSVAAVCCVVACQRAANVREQPAMCDPK